MSTMATLEAAAIAKDEEEKLARERKDRYQHEKGEYARPETQAELEELRAYLGDVGKKFDCRAGDMEMWYDNKNRRTIDELKTEAVTPPLVYDAVGAADAADAPTWQFLSSEGTWMNFGAAENEAVQKAKVDGEQTCTFETSQRRYELQFETSTQRNVKAGTERPVRLNDGTGLLTVDKYFGSLQALVSDLEYAVPDFMHSLLPQKQFELIDQANQAGPLRWACTETGFERVLRDTCENPSEKYFKKDEWVPLVTDVVTKATAIARAWPGQIGFKTVDDAMEQILSSGLEPNSNCGNLLASAVEFMTEKKKGHKKIQECIAKVDDRVKVVADLNQKSQYFDELEMLSSDLGELTPGGDNDEFQRMAPRLRELLQAFDVTSGLEERDGIEEKCSEWNDESESTRKKLDSDSVEAQIQLMMALARVTAAVKQHIDAMEPMLAKVEQKAKDIGTSIAELCADLTAKKKSASNTIDHATQKTAEIKMEVDAAEEQRKSDREKVVQQLSGLGEKNSELKKIIQDAMNEMAENEHKIRSITMLEKGEEATYQKAQAEREQQIGAVEACKKEMETYVTAISTSLSALDTTAQTAQLMLVDHPWSIKAHITKDVAATKDLGCRHDTQHFEVFCEAYKQTVTDETYTQKQELEAKRNYEDAVTEFKEAQAHKDGAKKKNAAAKKKQYAEQKKECSVQLTAFRDQLALMYESKEGDPPEECYGVKPVLERLGSLQAGFDPGYCLPVHDQYIGTIGVHVKHTCSDLCFVSGRKEKGGPRKELAGLTGVDGCPVHTDGAIALPPNDPRPELIRQVKSEAVGHMIIAVEEAEKRRRQSAERHAHEMKKIMGQEFLALEDGGMTRQSSTTKKRDAVIKYLDDDGGIQPTSLFSEGVPPTGEPEPE